MAQLIKRFVTSNNVPKHRYSSFLTKITFEYNIGTAISEDYENEITLDVLSVKIDIIITISLCLVLELEKFYS